MVEPGGGARVNQSQKVPEPVCRAVGIGDRERLPSRPFVVADSVDRGIPERVGAHLVARGDQGADRAEVDGATQGVGVTFATAEQVGVAVGPVVELDAGDVQTTEIVGDGGQVGHAAVGAIVGDERVAQDASVATRPGDLHRGASDLLVAGPERDAVGPRLQLTQRNDTSTRDGVAGKDGAVAVHRQLCRLTQVADLDGYAVGGAEQAACRQHCRMVRRRHRPSRSSRRSRARTPQWGSGLDLDGAGDLSP